MKKHFTSLLSAIMGGAIAIGGYHFLVKENISEHSHPIISESSQGISSNFQRVANFNFDENSFINASN